MTTDGERSQGNVTVRWAKKPIANLGTGKVMYFACVEKYVDGKLTHVKSKTFDRAITAQNFVRSNRKRWLTEGE